MLRPYIVGNSFACIASKLHPTEDAMKTCIAALAVLALFAAAISADPAEEARAEKERAKREAESKRRAAEKEVPQERKAGTTPVMVNNRCIDPVSGKVTGSFKAGSTYLAATPTDDPRLYLVPDARDANIRYVVDATTAEAWDPGEPLFKASGAVFSRTRDYIHEDRDEVEGITLRTKLSDPWSVDLPAIALTDCPRWFLERGADVFVSYMGGVARLSNIKGERIWTSVGTSGSLLLCGTHIISLGKTAKGVSEIVARTVSDGEVAWRTELAPKGDATLFSLLELGGKPAIMASAGGQTALIGADGRKLFTLPEAAQQARAHDERVLVITDKRAAMLALDGKPQWEVARSADNVDKDLWLCTELGPIQLSWCAMADSGVRATLRGYDGKELWNAQCESLGVPHSKYWHTVYGVIRGDQLVVVSQAAGGNFIETLSLKDGKQVARHKP